MNIFMDSGAFSAKTQGVEINIDDYIQYLKRDGKYFISYATLDVIGDAEKTWENTKIMEDAGLNPLPVYHLGTPFKYLHKCMEYDYFCLGGIAKARSNVRMEFLDEAFDEICDDDGMPRNKIHGFGVTATAILRRYPFYSVDSTSWLMTGANGGVLIPRCVAGEYRYDEDPILIAVSSGSPSSGKELRYECLNVEAKKSVDDYLKLKGYSMGIPGVENEHEEAGLACSYSQRIRLTMEYFLDLRDSLPEWPWSYEKSKKRRLW